MFKKLLILPLLLISCSSTSYTYYGLSLQQQSRGTLVADKDENNLDLMDTCFPSKRCVVLKKEEFFKLARDFAATKEKLKSCERK